MCMELFILSTGACLNAGKLLNDDPTKTDDITTFTNKLIQTRNSSFKKAISPP